VVSPSCEVLPDETGMDNIVKGSLWHGALISNDVNARLKPHERSIACLRMRRYFSYVVDDTPKEKR